MKLEEEAFKKFPAVMRDLEDYGDLLEDKSKLLNLELYNIVNRRDIVDAYIEEDLNFVNCVKPLEPDFLKPYLSRIKQSGFFIEFANEKTKLIRLVSDYFNSSIDQNIEIVLSASGYRVELFYVTPLNYLELKEGSKIRLRLYRPLVYYKRLVYDAISLGASDIHISNHYNNDNYDSFSYCIYYRLLNDYQIKSKDTLDSEFSDKLIREIVNEYAIEQAQDLGTPEGVKLSWLDPLYDDSCSLRITCSTSLGGNTLVCRVSRMSTIGKSIENLGFNYRMQKALEYLSDKEEGLTLITGAQRTGKNTTMVAMINNALCKKRKFIEYSSPIEVKMPFEQINFKDNIKGLYSYVDLAKKQDLDMVVISELPSKELAKPVIDLINSSIGVFTTFHINRIWHVFYKLKNYFGEDYIDLITQINGVVNQKMFVKQCPFCRVKKSHYDFPDHIKNFMKEYGISTFYESKGCPKCGGTGKSNVVQPYGEYVIFDESLKEKLLQCTEARFMEPIIKKAVMDNKSNLEYFIKEGIDLGDLHPTDFNKL